MKRSEILQRLGYTVPAGAVRRVIVDTDAKNEADDQYAILHHLLTPMFDVRGIIATHFESKAQTPGETMEMSYHEAQKLLALAQIDDVPLLRGCPLPLASPADAPDSEGVRFLIEEARKPDDRPLYIAVQGAMTNVAAALNRAPDIADKIVVLWNGGGPYPEGSEGEFNLLQDADACRALLASRAEVWQIPQNVYSLLEVSLAELAARVRPCGALGEYLFAQLREEYDREFYPGITFRSGENWTLGDNTTIAVLLSTGARWHMQRAPRILPDRRYAEDPDGRPIRVYDWLSARLTLEDLFAKLNLAYGGKTREL